MAQQRQPVHADITEDMIHALVHGFYAKVRADADLGPIFAAVITGDWDPHLATMCDFWSSVLLMSGRYHGAPMVAHMKLKMVRPEHFERWLALFGETAREVASPDVAALICARADNIARSLQMGMFFQPAGPR